MRVTVERRRALRAVVAGEVHATVYRGRAPVWECKHLPRPGYLRRALVDLWDAELISVDGEGRAVLTQLGKEYV